MQRIRMTRTTPLPIKEVRRVSEQAANQYGSSVVKCDGGAAKCDGSAVKPDGQAAKNGEDEAKKKFERRVNVKAA